MSNKVIVNGVDVFEELEKKEKLLEELKIIFNRHSLRLDRMREWFNLQILESKVLDDIEKLIKEIENEI